MTKEADQDEEQKLIPLWESWPYRVLSVFLALVIFLMMGLTFVDVLCRYVFSAPILGAYEIVTFLMALTVFAGLPLVTASRTHITVSLLDPLLRNTRRIRWVKEVVVLLISASVVAFMAYRLWEQGQTLREGQVVTPVLNTPIAPFAYYTSALSAVAFVILLAALWSHITRNRRT
ncbi:TRAP transporter small permease [Thermodesulfobacteriota bacterium]